jgi:hypothetical protein
VGRFTSEAAYLFLPNANVAPPNGVADHFEDFVGGGGMEIVELWFDDQDRKWGWDQRDAATFECEGHPCFKVL